MLLTLGWAPVAHAAVDGISGPGGVTITIVRWQGGDRVHAQGRGVDDRCDYGLALGPPGFVPDLSTVGPRPPDSTLAILTCDGEAVGLTWVGPHNTVDLGDAARAAAEAWVQQVPVPRPVIGVSPPDAGLVGVASWFWLDPPAGPITDRVEAFGVGVDVRIVPSPVTWAFGDGTTSTGGSGRPWPATSDIRHGYRQRGVMAVTATQRLEPAYRIDGTDWLALPSISVRAERAHRVREAQARLTG